MPPKANSETTGKLGRMKTVLAGHKNMLIVLQDFPDPDAIAAACALKELARVTCSLQSSMACSGVVGRAENRALVKYLGVNLLKLDDQDPDAYDIVAMVDTQPGTGNNSLPLNHMPDVVIDHHPIRSTTRRAPFYDIRSRYGSTSTIMYEYLLEEGIAPEVPLATSLVYGIRSDTNDLGRDATQADIDAYLALYPLSNKRKLGRIETERLPRDYFAILDLALRNARCYGRCVVSRLERIDNPDMIGEVADLLLRDEESTWAMCCGAHGGKLLISLRTSEPDAKAGTVARRLAGRGGSGGGHAAMAGAQVPLVNNTVKELQAAERRVIRRFLRILRVGETRGTKLIP